MQHHKSKIYTNPLTKKYFNQQRYSLSDNTRQIISTPKLPSQSLHRQKIDQSSKKIDKSIVSSVFIRNSGKMMGQLYSAQQQTNRQGKYNMIDTESKQTQKIKQTNIIHFQLANYKYLLQQQLQKTQTLNRNIRKQQKKNQQLEQINKHFKKQNKNLQSKLKNSKTLKKQMRQNIKQIDKKISQLWNVRNKQKLLQKHTVKQSQRINLEIKFTKDQINKYKIFVKGLSKSIDILKGVKVQKLDQIWQQWRKIIQQTKQFE